MYNDLLTYGDFIQLSNSCNSKELLEEIKEFEWKQYNPRKNINRYGLSITSNDGSLNGEDLYSLYEYSKEKGRICDEDEFESKLKLKMTHFKGNLQCDGFKRFMIIGA